MAGVFEQFPYTNFHDLNLDWILQTVKEALNEIGASGEVITNLTNKVNAAGDDIKALQVLSNELKTELQNVANGDYVELYLSSLISWIDNNVQQLVSKIVKYVAFEIDDTGHFIAYIPDTWKFLTFDTIVDTANPNYGHLVLEW
jgi:hypothetical protein